MRLSSCELIFLGGCLPVLFFAIIWLSVHAPRIHILNILKGHFDSPKQVMKTKRKMSIIVELGPRFGF